MEPRSAEQMPTPIEYMPSVPGAAEAGIDNFADQRERAAEAAGERLQQVTYAAAPASTAIPLPTPQPTQSTQLVDDDSPVIASDDDLIEKEWVDKAKRIIGSTKDDPYAREQAVVRLQTDYLRKRYGKVLGDNNVA